MVFVILLCAHVPNVPFLGRRGAPDVCCRECVHFLCEPPGFVRVLLVWLRVYVCLYTLKAQVGD